MRPLLLLLPSACTTTPDTEPTTDTSPPYGPRARCGPRQVAPMLIRQPYLQDVRPHRGRVVFGTSSEVDAPLPAAEVRWGQAEQLEHVVQAS
ncbi:MAG: hypothetical protein ACI9MC_003146, partial [Kiritimatiellia bacterium]